MRDGEEPSLSHEVDFKDNSSSSSVDVPVIREGEDESDGDSVALDQEGEVEFEDPDEYGERLVDKEGTEEEVEEAGAKKVSYYIGR
jgi:hypothetical protein